MSETSEKEALLLAEIDRLREQLRDAHIKVFHLEEKLSVVERERDQLMTLPAERILAALREPSEDVSRAVWREWGACDPQNHLAATLYALVRTAVAAAEREVEG